MRSRYSQWDGSQDPFGPDVPAAELRRFVTGTLEPAPERLRNPGLAEHRAASHHQVEDARRQPGTQVGGRLRSPPEADRHVVAVLGDDSFAAALRRLSEGRRVQERVVEVRDIDGLIDAFGSVRAAERLR